MIVPYTLKTISCMNIIIWDYESVWPDAWPQNKCRPLWPIFHGPMILCYIMKTIWCMNIILGDYGSVWPDVWPLNNCMSLWPIFHGRLIFPYTSETIWWVSVIFLDNETVWHKLWPQHDNMTYISWSSDFAWYLQDYLMGEHHSWYIGSARHNDWPHQV